ncbi:hypothetical protein PISMIDRAFT_682433 [Pisolithus microcarpus 441]|uniref:Uncharacterized protein n=1 Tax=Pisolithus microcarpus 441 TaxID=765257 RepID=A0A0C9YFV5_9AGAM|nr:hypothetical protein PISMIDRAFT_687277 [Pisolithus microcarpus 441]KIK20263.1 hypothetical protein PISMIDRAFT_682433 [Pisolithus microcarpus 441]
MPVFYATKHLMARAPDPCAFWTEDMMQRGHDGDRILAGLELRQKFTRSHSTWLSPSWDLQTVIPQPPLDLHRLPDSITVGRREKPRKQGNNEHRASSSLCPPDPFEQISSDPYVPCLSSLCPSSCPRLRYCAVVPVALVHSCVLTCSPPFPPHVAPARSPYNV